MSTKDDALPDAPSPHSINTLKALVYRVSRTFYDTKEILVLDVLNKRLSIKDEELARCLRMNTRDVNKLCSKLREDRLIRMESRGDGVRHGKPVLRWWCTLDYKLFVDVTKLRLYKMRMMIDAKMRSELENKGYICPNCQKTYTPLEAQSLIDPTTFLFNCEICGTNLENNENEEGVRLSQEALSRFIEQTNPITEILKQTDQIKLPVYNPLQTPAENAAITSTRTVQKDIQLATETGTSATNDIVVVFETDDATARAKREEELEKKRQQNALPVWHQFSTVSGEPVQGTSTPPGEDEDLDEDIEFEKVEAGAGEEETKEDEDDYYKQYYASLLAQQSAVSESGGSVESPDSNEVEDEDGDEDEEFVAVSVPDSLNSSGSNKRKLSDDEVNEGGEAKRVKIGNEDTEEEGEDDSDEDIEFEEVGTPESDVSLS
ncbi:hypothetical protein BKA69DRAFT_1175601 [Paraphysoderma sedebokerense]|nr:hypothetical protein BKA69DRAFT_1175601 [Paraphysoderma sedebokerense]